jgi:phospholipid/cholesterol/gamma-HCH transport system substrate-binding protein
MTDQTRTGTYGSWYNYYVCGFSGEIKLPVGIDNLPIIQQLQTELNKLSFRSTAPRCADTGSAG